MNQTISEALITIDTTLGDRHKTAAKQCLVASKADGSTEQPHMHTVGREQTLGFLNQHTFDELIVLPRPYARVIMTD